MDRQWIDAVIQKLNLQLSVQVSCLNMFWNYVVYFLSCWTVSFFCLFVSQAEQFVLNVWLSEFLEWVVLCMG
jgi:hypothetical protein